MSKNFKFKITYCIVWTTLFSLAQFVLPVAAQIKNSNEMSKTQDESNSKCQFTGHFSFINSVDISPDGKKFITASYDNNIKLWDISTGALLHTFQGAGTNALISPDGKTLTSASNDKTIKLWDISTKKLIRTLEGHSEQVSSFAISFDGKTLISGSWDKTIKIWDISTGKLIRRLRGHSESVNSAIITPNSATIISSSSDKTIKLWDIKTAREIRTLKENISISKLAIS
jgi:WD40 repeat protein